MKERREMGTSPHSAASLWVREELRADLRKREGAEAIYRNRGIVAHVRVTEIRADDDAVHATATLLQPAVTFCSRYCKLVSLTDHWDFGGAYRYLLVRPWVWAFTYFGPSVFFDRQLIDDLSELGFRPIEGSGEGEFSLSQYDDFLRYTQVVGTFRRNKLMEPEVEAKPKTSLWDWLPARPTGKSADDLFPEL
jgi:hypothetical protein